MADPFFDTGVVADWLLGHDKAANELLRYRKHRISRIVWTALLAREPVHQRSRLVQLLAPFEIVEVDARIAAAAADLCNRSPMSLMDALILATAQVNGAILITRNTKDFPANMPGIRVPYTL